MTAKAVLIDLDDTVVTDDAISEDIWLFNEMALTQ